MAKIKLMDELLANKIAAGEVVERCCSVVKELVENSIDALSSEIRIDLIEAGTKSIKVTDDGIGMDREDAVLSFERHATSKIKVEDDLYHINTLGFRGEALSSIASVSEITLKTCSSNVGTTVIIKGGKIISVENSEARKGTIMLVENLFYNTPARLKHLKSLYTELASITEYVDRIALSHPNIKFILTNNNSQLLNTDGSNQLLKTIKNVFGIELAKKMMEIKGSDSDYDISGYISLPEAHRSSRNSIITLVNGRVVRNATLNKTINDSYHSYKPDNRYPVVVINIEVDPTLVDVNIHPTKMDIKFSKQEELMTLISGLIKEKLKKGIFIPKAEEKRIEIEVSKKNYEETKLELERVEEESVPYVLEDNKYELRDDEKEVNSPLFTIKKEEVTKKNRLPELYPVGVIHGTYIICQNEDGMTLIDQHAAKERINYEFYKKKMGNPSRESIPLLIPFTIELTNSDFIVLKQHYDILNNIGFVICEFGLNSIIVKEHPTWLLKGYEKDATNRIIETIVQMEKDFTIEKFNESIATMLSCKMAIKANENISILEMESLINDLRKCDNPFNCPHGRPTMISYSNYDLEKLFKRSGF